MIEYLNCIIYSMFVKIYQYIRNMFLSKEEIEERNEWAQMRKREAEEDVFRTLLRQQGHTCIQILESFPSQTRWCGQMPCTNY